MTLKRMAMGKPGAGEEMEQKVDRQNLEIYLGEHLRASKNCLKRLEVITCVWRGTAQQARLDTVYEQVRDDRNDLQAIAGRLKMNEVSSTRWRKFALRVVGGFMVHAVLRPVRAQGTQMELDVIAGLLHSKLAMWNTLLSLVTSESRLDPVQLIHLSDRTEQQIRVLKEITEETRPEQFTRSA